MQAGIIESEVLHRRTQRAVAAATAAQHAADEAGERAAEASRHDKIAKLRGQATLLPSIYS